MSDLKERCKQMFAITEKPVTKFCRAIGMSTTAYYKWMKDELNLSDERLEAIDTELKRMNY